jgi:hypothetical protein
VTGPDVGEPLVQGQEFFDTVISDVIPKSEFDKLMQTNYGISFRIKLSYTGLNGTTYYSTGLCMSHTALPSLPYCKTDNYVN